MTVDASYLAGLAAVHVGLLDPADLPLKGPWPLHDLLADRCPPEVLHDLLTLAAALSADDLAASEVVAALVDLLVQHGLDNSMAATQRDHRSGTAAHGADGVLREAPGRYQHGRNHARGGMGRILQVYDQIMARRIALKELLPVHADVQGGSTLDAANPNSDPATRQQRARFLHEARRATCESEERGENQAT